MSFKLDPRLAGDCYLLADSKESVWLLLNNSYFPWFIVVPKTEATELYQLSQEAQQQLQRESHLISEFAYAHFECDKLNIASIGNIVRQMHLHIIVRKATDPCWPGVVWGTHYQRAYKMVDVQEIQKKLQLFCQNKSINGLDFVPLQ